MDRTRVSAACCCLLLWGGFACAQDGVYRLNSEGADIRILVYRAGPLARLGHSHVISVGELTGSVTVQPDIEQSTFEMAIPVDGLVVDDPLLRSEEGEEFTSEPSEDDIAGTRSNMLGEQVLNAAQFPVVSVRGTGPIGDGAQTTVTLAVEILGRVIERSFPITLAFTADRERLTATGAVRITHADLGMTPFTAVAGALRVAEEIDLKYHINAERVSASVADSRAASDIARRSD